MTPAGWFIMIGALSGVTGLLLWCVYKVLSTPQAEKHVHSTLDIHKNKSPSSGDDT